MTALLWLARIPRWAWITLAVLVLVIGGGVALVSLFKGTLDQHAREASATAKTTERAAHHEEVIKNVEKAKRVSDSPSNAALERVRSKYDRSHPDGQ